MGLFTRLAFDNVGSIDWEPHISKVGGEFFSLATNELLFLFPS